MNNLHSPPAPAIEDRGSVTYLHAMPAPASRQPAPVAGCVPERSEDVAALALMGLYPGLEPEGALSLLRQGLEALRDPTSPTALDAVARQVPVLEALFATLAARAVAAPRASDAVALAGVALKAQTAHARTVTLLQGLDLQRRGRGCVLVQD